MTQLTLDETEDLLIRAARITKAVYSEIGAMPGEVNQTRLFEVVTSGLFEGRVANPRCDPVVLCDPEGNLVVLQGEPGTMVALPIIKRGGWAFWRR